MAGGSMTSGTAFSPTARFNAASTCIIPMVSRLSDEGTGDTLQVPVPAGFQGTNKEK